MSYKLRFVAYCGMGYTIGEYETRDDARSAAADRLRSLRREYAVTTLTQGTSWEILEPDDAVLVPDECGTLSLLHITYECCECGYCHETRDDARVCCALTEDY